MLAISINPAGSGSSMYGIRRQRNPRTLIGPRSRISTPESTDSMAKPLDAGGLRLRWRIFPQLAIRLQSKYGPQERKTPKRPPNDPHFLPGEIRAGQSDFRTRPARSAPEITNRE